MEPSAPPKGNGKTLGAYARLMRLHQPTGIWLLLIPCWWGLALAWPGMPQPYWYALFAVGAVCMRSAGCIVNDMADRRIDAQVARTRTRPLASGEVSMREAWLLLALCLLLGLWVWMALPCKARAFAVMSLPFVAVYPFSKRFIAAPQVLLGVTFNWGVPTAALAMTGTISPALWALYTACIFWTIGYDTLYAHQDKADDARIGVKSTALLAGGQARAFVAVCYAITSVLLLVAGILGGMGWLYMAALLTATLLWQRQAWRTPPDNPAACALAFRRNRDIGLLLFAAMVAERAL